MTRDNGLAFGGFRYHRGTVSHPGRVGYSHTAADYRLYVTLDGATRKSTARIDCRTPVTSKDRAGAVTFIPAGWSQNAVLDDANIVCGHIEIEPEYLLELGEFDQTNWKAAFNANEAHLFRLVAQLNAVAERPHETPAALAQGLAVAVTHTVAAVFGGVRRRRDDSRLDAAALRRALALIEEHDSFNPTLAELATEAGLGVSAFLRGFRGVMGHTPGQYIVMRRLDRAALLLKETRKPIFEIAQATGFSSQAHLTTAFRRKFGVAPGGYRKGG